MPLPPLIYHVALSRRSGFSGDRTAIYINVAGVNAPADCITLSSLIYQTSFAVPKPTDIGSLPMDQHTLQAFPDTTSRHTLPVEVLFRIFALMPDRYLWPMRHVCRALHDFVDARFEEHCILDLDPESYLWSPIERWRYAGPGDSRRTLRQASYFSFVVQRWREGPWLVYPMPDRYFLRDWERDISIVRRSMAWRSRSTKRRAPPKMFTVEFFDDASKTTTCEVPVYHWLYDNTEKEIKVDWRALLTALYK